MSTASHPWIGRSLRAAYSQLGEFIHLCAIYLGIAVLVTIAAGAVVPSIRDQASQIYAVVVEAIRPAALSNEQYANLGGFGQQEPSTRTMVTEDGEEIQVLSSSSAYGGFAQTLEQASAGVAISGVSRAQMQGLHSYISRKYKVAGPVTNALIHLAYVNGKEKNLDPLLILAVIAIESTYNPFVESHAGAQGLMQVMTRVHKDKLEMYTEGNLAVFSPEANIRAGSQILHDCRKRRGSITGALACYVGATGPSDGGYGAKVLAERRRIALASGIAVKD